MDSLSGLICKAIGDTWNLVYTIILFLISPRHLVTEQKQGSCTKSALNHFYAV